MEDLIALLARATTCPPSTVCVALRPALEHQSNRLYDGWAGGRHLILKEFLKPAEFATAPKREMRALELLAPLDIAPQPVWFEPGRPPERGPIVIYEFMDGQMWDRRRPSPAGLAALASTWLTMHAVEDEQARALHVNNEPVDKLYAAIRARLLDFVAWTESSFSTGQRAAELCLQVAERGQPIACDLASLVPVLRFCRSDARFANVIDRPGGHVGMVDWEDSGLRDPARDVVDLMTHPNEEDLLSPDEWQAFLRPYLSGLAVVDPELGQRVHLYGGQFPSFWLSVLTMIGIRHAREGRLAGWTINDLPANTRLRRYLARAQAWPDADFTAHLDALGDLAFFPDR